MQDYKAPGTDWFLKNELTPPKTQPHGTDEDIRNNLKPAKMWGWKLVGNQLECETDLGKLVQTIPSDYILVGEDENNHPILRKIGQ